MLQDELIMGHTASVAGKDYSKDHIQCYNKESTQFHATWHARYFPL